MKLNEALKIAEKVKAELEPFCEKIEIAGSIRRKKPEVKDIEIVCIPKPFGVGLFESGIAKTINKWKKIKGEPNGKYTQRILPEGIKLDLFFAVPENWGAILLIRTGDWEFSKKFMGTIMPRNGLKQQYGYVYQDGNKISIESEEQLFKICGYRFIEPYYRNVNAL